MKYFEITVDGKKDELDKLCDELSKKGIGFILEDENDFREFLKQNQRYWDYVDGRLSQKYIGLCRIKFYIDFDEDGIERLGYVKKRWPDYIISTVQDSDWENNWKEFYKPINIGKRLIVVPQWETIPDKERTPLILDPGLIFGTGNHATTRMCLEVLDSLELKDKRILDLGCGSGILGIGALVLGACSSVGVDIDPKAPDVAMSNAALNGIGNDRMKVLAGDILSNPSLSKNIGGGYDVVVANIVADVIIALAPKVLSFMKKNAIFICSGIIEGREKEVSDALISAGLKIDEAKMMEEWSCFVCSAA